MIFLQKILFKMFLNYQALMSGFLENFFSRSLESDSYKTQVPQKKNHVNCFRPIDIAKGADKFYVIPVSGIMSPLYPKVSTSRQVPTYSGKSTSCCYKSEMGNGSRCFRDCECCAPVFYFSLLSIQVPEDKVRDIKLPTMSILKMRVMNLSTQLLKLTLF